MDKWIPIGTSWLYGEPVRLKSLPKKVTVKNLAPGEVVVVEIEAKFVGEDGLDYIWLWNRDFPEDEEVEVESHLASECTALREVVVKAKTNMTVTKANVEVDA